MYIRHVEIPDVDACTDYAAQLPAVREIVRAGRLDFSPSVTFFTGENGSGKSTLLEAIAVAAGFNAEGGTINFRFSTYASHSQLARALRLVRAPHRQRDGFFLRAESFYNVASEIDRLDDEFSFGGPAIDSYGGVSLHAQSHGESFMALITHRFGGDGLYILDEPEAALSPSRQMALLAQIHRLVKARSQFLIATHSPILMAYPGAVLYVLDEQGIGRREYRQTDHYLITRAFLEKPQKMLDILFEDV